MQLWEWNFEEEKNISLSTIFFQLCKIERKGGKDIWEDRELKITRQCLSFHGQMGKAGIGIVLGAKGG